MAAPNDVTCPSGNSYISVLHCNAQSARKKNDELVIFLAEFRFKFQVIMVTETWYSSTADVLNLPGYESFFLNRSHRRGGGVLQLVSKQFACAVQPDFSEINADYEVITTQSENKLFAVIYRPPNGNINRFFKFLETLLNFTITNKLQIIIGGDCNINLLGNTAASREFQILLTSLSCGNVITEPTRITDHSESLLDVFVTNNMSDCVKSGRIITGLSDHFPIYMIYKCNTFLKRKISHSDSYTVRDISSRTLEVFRNEISSIKWSPVFACQNAQQAYEIFLSLFKSCYHTCFRLKTVNKSKKLRKPWMTDECFKMIKRKEQLYAKFVKTRSLDDLSAFKKYRNSVTTTLRKTKNAYFENLFNNSTSQTDVLWRELNKILNTGTRNNQVLQLTVNAKTLEGKDLADEFNKYFTNLSSGTLIQDSAEIKKYLGAPNPKSAFFEPTTDEEIYSTFMSLKNSKARDIDDLEIKPVKYVLDLLTPALCHIYNTCLHTGTFPDIMQCARVGVIYKSGDQNNFSNYRPISVLPVFSKGLEKIICKRITSFCDKHKLLSPQQFGFRRGMSTELALLTQKELILRGFENNKMTLGILIDFSKAFDRIDHKILSTKLEHYGFRGVSGNLLKSYLNHRKQCVVINKAHSSLLNVTSGVPQGSILGPVLFNIYINDIVNTSTLASYIIYADDTSIFFQSASIEELTDFANVTLEKFSQWTQINSLQINVAKTRAILFTPVQKVISRDIDIKLGSEQIKVVKEIKTLGVTFNQHLNWNAHVERVAGNLARACGVLCKFRTMLPTKIKLILYNSIFAPHINYCSLVWTDTTQSNLTKLMLLQKKAIRHVANASYDAHTRELFASFNVLPIHHIHKLNLIMKYKHSVQTNNETFLNLCNLHRPLEVPYIFRNREHWSIPSSRTNQGRHMLQYHMPTYLNFLQNKNIDIHNLSKYKWQKYLILEDI